MTPSQQMLVDAARVETIRDSRGRCLTVRRLTALDTLRLLKAAGPVLAQNQPWLNMAALAMAVTSIDGIPVVTPGSEAQIEGIVGQLGEEGLSAIADATLTGATSMDTDVSNAGNLPGTPT